MRVFKHGDSLAIVIPPSIRQSSAIAENDEFEFVELEPGIFVMVSRQKLSQTVSDTVTGMLVKKASENSQNGKPERMPAGDRPALAAYSRDEPVAFVSAAQIRQTASRAAPSIESALGGKSFAVLEESDAKNVSKVLEAEINAGLVLGVRGFDNKFYVITRGEFDSLCAKIQSRLQRNFEILPDKAAAVLSEDAQKVSCALHVLTAKGEALEKRKGVFVLLD